MDFSVVNIVYVILFFGGFYYTLDYISRRKKQQDWANAKTSARDVVTVHGFPASSKIPNPSPFVFKLLTFLRAAKIPYEIDEANPLGPSGKSPWISLNGQQYTDSELIINMLSKKYNKNFNEGFTDSDLAVGRAVRVMLEERWFWCLPLWRFVWSQEGWASFFQLLTLKQSLMNFLTIKKFSRSYANNAKGHGVGRLPKEQLISFMLDDMRAVATILGDKKFILGSKPCQDDFAIFAQLAQAMWDLHGSPYEKYINSEAPNLKNYLLRMKELCWGSDWDASLRKQ